MKSLLSNSKLYFWLRNIGTGGIPYKTWKKNLGLENKNHRILDLGCGTCDIYKFLEQPNQPEFVLGIDFSDKYLETAEKKLKSTTLNYQLINLDLEKLNDDQNIQQQLKDIIATHQLNHVVLIGVLHHLPNHSILNTLKILFEAPTIKTVATLDIVYNGKVINDLYAKNDRGEFVRTEAEYEQMLNQSAWKIKEKVWSNPGIKSIKYLQHNLYK